MNLSTFQKRRRRSSPIIVFTILQLLQRNVHLGASVAFSLLSSHWFISGTRQSFTIINLNFTIMYYRRFLSLIEYVILARRRILFVNDKHYLTAAVADVALTVGEAYALGYWIGGTLTNFKKMLISYHKLLKYDNHKVLTGRKYYLRRSLKGLTSLNTLPGAVFFNSIRTNYWGVREAHALKLPSAAILDTDSDPADVLYPVPGNDDAFGSIYFLNQLVAKTILITKIGRLLKFGSKKALFSKFNKNLLNRSGKGRGQGGWRRRRYLNNLRRYNRRGPSNRKGPYDRRGPINRRGPYDRGVIDKSKGADNKGGHRHFPGLV